MMSLTYGKLELLICLHFSMAATGINKEGVSLVTGSSTILPIHLKKESQYIKTKILNRDIGIQIK